ncbi:hypothetical protein CAPTEDRAFT_218562 [Capitella teleta]|uniref:Uncharacterized protein n=1 Tax=Capitella teleta TaxID=283909 RepID=R7VG48_CAPTE|nr:hypothetical protein CAPTEDRAFT_218562 [Capitella teleta]|eukprot:ELU14655.1 hypothetical protein CAPTEDRAFT_218562 [Capitella teleta]
MPTELSSDEPIQGTSDNTQLTKQERRDKILDLFNYLFTPDNAGSANHGAKARRPTDTTSDLPRERTTVESHMTKQEQRDKILELQIIEKLTAMKKQFAYSKMQVQRKHPDRTRFRVPCLYQWSCSVNCLGDVRSEVLMKHI